MTQKNQCTQESEGRLSILADLAGFDCSVHSECNHPNQARKRIGLPYFFRIEAKLRSNY
jgi:hypothetical protein